MHNATTGTDIDTLISRMKEATFSFSESLNAVQQPRIAVRHAMGSKHEIVLALMQGVEQRYGIAHCEQVERKLLRVFDCMSFDDLKHWSVSMFSPGADDAEWLSLVESLTVHETYFDRDKEQLGVFATEILPRLIEQKQRSGERSLRIWSAGCASGEETYNLAMLTLIAMKNAGYAFERTDGSIIPTPTWKISLLGSDISSQMIRLCKNASYSMTPMGSFRAMNPQLWNFFDEVKGRPETAGGSDSMRIKRCVTDITRFRCHNLLEPLIEAQRFDCIICRNVMIYFCADSKKIVQRHLVDSLSEGGSVMLGATDLMLCQQGLERRQHHGSFWYTRNAAGEDNS